MDGWVKGKVTIKKRRDDKILKHIVDESNACPDDRRQQLRRVSYD